MLRNCESPFRNQLNLALSLIAFILIGAMSVVAQTTIHVPAEQPTIQAGIDAAVDGDTVLVAPGTYYENIDFKGKAITVISEAGVSDTTIDGGKNGSVVTFANNETSASVLTGFTITDGYVGPDSAKGSFGGGIVVSFAAPTIRNNIITRNTACSGAGIFLAGVASIERNTISENVSPDDDAACPAIGGALALSGVSYVTISGNTIENNRMSRSGGGIALYMADHVVLKNNMIIANSTSADGGGIYSEETASGVQMLNNVIAKNRSSDLGGGISIHFGFQSYDPSSIRNNTIADNVGYGYGAAGVYLTGDGFAELENNVISGTYGFAVSCVSASISGFQFNDVFGLANSSKLGYPCSVQAGPLGYDPMFAGSDVNNYHLQYRSGLIDAGNNSFVTTSTDLDGVQRIQAGLGSNATVDIGAYEYVTTTASTAPQSLDFPSEKVGNSSDPLSFTVTNTGAAALQIYTIQVPDGFTQTNNCRTASGIPAGHSCQVNVSLVPTTTGTFSGQVNIDGNAAIPPVSVSGHTALLPAVQLSATSVTFGYQPMGATSAAQGISITNVGDGPLTVSGVAATNEFGATHNCPAKLQPASSCVVSITFSPGAVGPQSGIVYVYDDASDSPQHILVSGTGVSPDLSSSPSTLDFGLQAVGTSSASITIVIRNTTPRIIVLQPVHVSPEFAVVSGCTSAKLFPSRTCSIQVVFSPSRPSTPDSGVPGLGVTTGALIIYGDMTGGVFAVPLSGTAVYPQASLSPSTLTFSDQIVGTIGGNVKATFKNDGVVPVTITSAATTGDFTLNADCCVAVVPVGGLYNIPVTFAPKTVGTLAGSLTVNSNASVPQRTILLNGRAVPPPPPTADSLTPTSGSGNATFAFKFSDESSYSNINLLQGVVNSSASYVGGCVFMYLPGNNKVSLMNDAGNAWVGSVVAGTATTLSNSQCTVDVSGVSASGSGNQLTLNVPISFASAFAGQKNVYAYAANATGNNSGWQKVGTWTPNPPVFVPIPTAPTVDSGAYDPGTKSMTFAFSSVNGYAYIEWAQGVINTGAVYASGCAFHYVQGTNQLYLMNDAGTALQGPVTLGVTGSLSNTQCTIDAAQSSATGSGNSLTLKLALTESTSVSGTQNIYGYARDRGGLSSGWIWLGSWLPNPPLATTPPRAVSATSTPGIMSFTFASDNGGSFISWVQAVVAPTYSYANGCTVYYLRSTKRLYLMNDAGTAWLGPLYLGQNTSVANSQCTIYAGNSTELITGNNLTLNVSATYATGFMGVRNAWGYAVDNVGKKSQWVNLGPFTVQ